MEIYLPIAEMSVHWLILLGMAAAVGILSGMLGVGGGFLLTPLLIFYGIPSEVAVATTASHLTASSMSGAIAQWRRKAVDFKMAGVMLAGGLVGSWLGVFLSGLLRAAGQSAVVTCSALKQSYRETLIAGLPHDVYRFVLTEAPKEVIAQRMLMRHDHFMPETLLDSQIATLELPADALHVSAEQLPDVAARQVLKSMKIVPST